MDVLCVHTLKKHLYVYLDKSRTCFRGVCVFIENDRLQLMHLIVNVSCCVECCRDINKIMKKVCLGAISRLNGGMAGVGVWRISA